MQSPQKPLKPMGEKLPEVPDMSVSGLDLMAVVAAVTNMATTGPAEGAKPLGRWGDHANKLDKKYT